MKHPALKYLLPPALIVGAMVLVVLLANMRSAPAERAPTQTATPVQVIEARIGEQAFSVRSQGTVRPVTESALSAEVSGRLVSVSDSFVAGGYFQAGDVLAEIDPADYQAALLQAEADLARAQAQLSEEQARSDQARRDWVQARGTGSEPNELILRLPQVAGAKAAVQAAEASVQQASRNLERTRVRVPFDGLVRQREADLGAFVSTGSVLGRVFAIESAEVRLPLSDRDLAFLDLPPPGRPDNTGPAVQLTARLAGEQRQWNARIVRTEAVIDETTRLSYAVARVADPYALMGQSRASVLPIGTFVQAEIEGRLTDGLIRLPRGTLRQDNQLYLANDEDELEIRQVEVVRSTPEHVYVRGDIEVGERVITTAMPTPLPGQLLSVESDERLASGLAAPEDPA